VTEMMRFDNRPDTSRQWVNLFAIANQAELTMAYRLLEVRGLPSGESYDKNLNRLVKAVCYEIRQPVALVRRGDAHCLAIPANAELPMLEQPLMPHVAILVPSDRVLPLEFASLDKDTAPIAITFLQTALRTPLWQQRSLWGSGRAYYSKRALNADDTGTGLDVYPGFVWSVVATSAGRLFLAVDTIIRYVDRCWLPERLNGNHLQRYLHRHCLYHFGHQWYVIQLWGATGLSVTEQRFVPEGVSQPVDVLTHTRQRWRDSPPAWVRNLDPASPAIVYRYPGNEKERYGALALCKLTLSSADAKTAGLQRRATWDPAPRLQYIRRVVEHYFQQARLGGQRINVATAPLDVERRVFPVPPQRFGHGRILAVSPEAVAQATDIVSLEQLGRRRLGLALDPHAGPLDTSPFDAQYLMLPYSLPRPINEDFERRFVQAMREVSGQPMYKVQRILYDDRGARSLYRQVQVIQRAIAHNRIGRGYALLVLPAQAQRDLHNYIKRTLWPDLQCQCAMASKIHSYYERQKGNGLFRPVPERMGRLTSYVRNCAFGMMVVNRKWSWALATPLHHDIYIGIDVLNRMVGLTFIYNHGEQIFFRDYPCKQKERLTALQLREILTMHLGQDLQALGLRPRSVVIHRDGRTFTSELNGLHAAAQALKSEGILANDVVIGVVDIRKTTADHWRLVEGERLEVVQNPAIGSHYIVGPREGIVCTTGLPFRFPGTAKPLAAVIAEGALNIEWVLEDIFALSQPVFTAPDKCGRLPLTIKLAHDFLEPIASSADDEAALYEHELPGGLEDIAADEFRTDRAAMVGSRMRRGGGMTA
jgi:hypothetical protein